jgi:hypothetical protein
MKLNQFPMTMDELRKNLDNFAPGTNVLGIKLSIFPGSSVSVAFIGAGDLPTTMAPFLAALEATEMQELERKAKEFEYQEKTK